MARELRGGEELGYQMTEVVLCELYWAELQHLTILGLTGSHLEPKIVSAAGAVAALGGRAIAAARPVAERAAAVDPFSSHTSCPFAAIALAAAVAGDPSVPC